MSKLDLNKTEEDMQKLIKIVTKSLPLADTDPFEKGYVDGMQSWILQFELVSYFLEGQYSAKFAEKEITTKYLHRGLKQEKINSSSYYGDGFGSGIETADEIFETLTEQGYEAAIKIAKDTER